MKRVFLLVVTNLAVMLLLGVIVNIVFAFLGVSTTGRQGDLIALLVFAAVFGFGGAFISLLLSKPMAKLMTRARVITGREGVQEAWLVQTVETLARTANVKMPEVAIYEGAPNAFATGASRNSSLVAVSTGLMRGLSQAEVRAVLGHEMAHVANGDMITMTLLQGVLNTFVILLSRIIGTIVDKAVFKNRRGLGIGYFVTYMAVQTILGILASMIAMAYSRHREYRADAGAADYLGSPGDMIAALRRLGGMAPGPLPEAMKSFGINNRRGYAKFFSSHPPIEERIARLQNSTRTTSGYTM